MANKSESTAYGSAWDLPSVNELSKQLYGARILTRFVWRSHRAEVLELERRLNEITTTVDTFYIKLGERNWVFHDDLSLTAVKHVVDASSVDEAEARLIEMYGDEGTLESLINRLNGLPAMRIRRQLIDKALLDYREGRYYATVLVLLTVMDGFVNDMDNQRVGLHAREPEDLIAWDSVVGHHMGLSHAHQSSRKGTRKTTDEEMVELHRNGILHGTILSYDNTVVASKAWNRLFAVADWAKSLERKNQPVPPRPSFRDLLNKMQALSQDQRVLKAWKPSTLAGNDAGFSEEPIVKSAQQFLEAWQKRNYGYMARSFPDSMIPVDPKSRPARVRTMFERDLLEKFTIERVAYTAAAAAEVDVDVVVNGVTSSIRMRWIREKVGSNHPAMREEDGEWRLYIGLYEAMKRRRAESMAEG